MADMTIDGTLPPNGSGADLISTNGLQIDWQRGDIPPGNGPVQILYDPSNGNLSVNSPARSVTTFEVISDSGLFIPKNISPGVLNPPFDVISPSKLFKLCAGAGAYNDINFGNILPARLGCDSLISELTIRGSLTPDDSGNNALDASGLDVCFAIPEPSGILLLSLGFLTLLGFARRQGNPTR